jgi:GT2 family glycosyltransferase
MKRQALVSIITVNFKQALVTNQLLASLEKITWSNFEVIVVDNASGEEDLKKLNLLSDRVRLLKSDLNLGFAGGNNLAIREAKGDYLLFLNNDTEVDPTFLEPLVTKMESNPKLGGVSPKIKFYYQPELIQFAGQAAMNPFTIRSFGYGYKAVDRAQFDVDIPTHFLHGAAMMVSRMVIEKAALMPECYFLYYEELDWCSSIKKAGFDLGYVHNSVVMHKESVSTGKNSAFKTYYLNRSRLLFLRRNSSGLTFIAAILFQVFIAIPKNVMLFIFKGEFDFLWSYIKAVVWNLKAGDTK